MKNKLIALALSVGIIAFVATGCDNNHTKHVHHHNHSTNQVVTVYKTVNQNYVSGVSSPSDQWLWWYIMMSGNNYYYYYIFLPDDFLLYKNK